MSWSGFIVRPFGRRRVQPPGVEPSYYIDFDRVQRDLLDPVFRDVGIKVQYSEPLLVAGNVREDMFGLLLQSDLVLFDISLHNANVFYQLGLRHAMRPKRTFLVRFRGDEVPFDIKTDRYLAYDRDNPAGSIDALTAALRATLEAGERTDSPIFNLLPTLKAPLLSELTPVPGEFTEELHWALSHKRVGHLELLAEEAGALPWGAEGLRIVADALVRLRAYAAACRCWEAVRLRLDRDLESDLRLASLYQRFGNLSASDQAIERALTQHPTIRPEQRAEALSLRGSNAKNRWIGSWTDRPSDQLGAIALHSAHLQHACDAFAAAFNSDLNHFYSGVNALSMARIQLELAKLHPGDWADTFESDDDAERAREELEERVRTLESAVELSVRRAQSLAPPGSEEARWVRTTSADVHLLRNERASRVAATYRAALEGAPSYFLDSLRRQLDLYSRLGLFTDVVGALQTLVATLTAASDQSTLGPASTPTNAIEGAEQRVLLFIGHMFDSVDRPTARFPAAQEPTARIAIRQLVEQSLLAWPVGTQVLGMAGGACGGDILFHEVCAELGVPTELYLAMSSPAYIAASARVDLANDSRQAWTERFEAIRSRTAATGRCFQLDEARKRHERDFSELPSWLSHLPNYSIWERNNRWMMHSALVRGADRLTLLVLWDGMADAEAGDTQHMIDVAREAGSVVLHINSRALFRLD